MRFRRLSILLAFMITTPASGQSDALSDALERMIAAYGGAENLQKLDSMVQEWDLLALTRNQRGSDKRSVRLPEQLKVELTYPDKQETRVLNGDSGYAIFDDRAPTAASAMQTSAMRLQLMRLYSPLTLRDKRDALELSRSDGYVVLTLREHGLQTDYVVSADTWHIVKVMGKLSVNGAAMRFFTEYSDHAMVDGVLVHHRENKWVGSMNTAMLRLQHITVDAHFDDDEFEPVENRRDPVIARIAVTSAFQPCIKGGRGAPCAPPGRHSRATNRFPYDLSCSRSRSAVTPAHGAPSSLLAPCNRRRDPAA